jgi:DNA-binding transcriptional MocR family regulator
MIRRWTPEIGARVGPRYLAIVEAIAADVAAGRLAPGDRLPTHRELARRLGLTIGTVTRAYAEAEGRGLVAGEIGRGTYVRERPTRAVQPIVDRPVAPTIRYDLTVARAAPDGPAAAMLAARLAEIGPGEAARLLDYAPQAGAARHRAAAAAFLAADGIDADPARIVLTNGAHHGVLATLVTLARPRDAVLTEAITFYGARAMSNVSGLQFVGVAADRDGIDPDALAEAIRRHAPRAVLVTPSFQNPTGSVMPRGRRERVVDVCLSAGVTLVEDGVHDFLDPSLPPLAALAPENCVHVTSLSKAFAAGPRFGFVHAPRRLVDAIAAAVRGSSIMVSALVAETGARLIESGDVARAAAWHAARLRRRHAVAASILPDAAGAGAPGGPHWWLRLPRGLAEDRFMAALRAAGVDAVAGGEFAVGAGAAPGAVRLVLGAPPTDDDLAETLRRVAATLSARGRADGRG